MTRLLGLALLLLALAPAAHAQNGPQAYHGTRATGPLDEKVEPQNVAAPYDGPVLQLKQTYVGRDAAEPTVGVDLEGNAFYAASAFDALGTGLLARTEVLASFDGGLTFKNVSPNVGGQSIPPTTLDPYVYVDSKTGRVFSVDLAGAGSYISYSDDKGASWLPTATTSPGFNDHQSFSSAPPPEGSPLFATSDSFPNILYYCVNHVSDSRCSRSTDGGQSFVFTGTPPFSPVDGCAGGLHGHLEGGPDGTIYLPAGRCGPNVVSSSSDAGTTWTETVVSPDIESTETHTAVGIDANDNVYTVWYDPVHRLPWLSVSTDHGKSWSKPLMIAPPGVKAVNFPEIIAGDEGRIAINFPGTAFNDTEQEPNPDRPWNYYMVVSTNALDPNPLFHSNIANSPSDPLHRGECSERCAGMFDFYEITVSPFDGSVWGSGTDTCTAANDCPLPDGTASMADDAEGISVRQLGGPWLVGPTPRGGVVPGTKQVPEPATPGPQPKPVAPPARSAKVRCAKPQGKKVTCRVSVASAPGGAKVGLKLKKGRTLVASGTRPLDNGAAKIVLRSKRAIRRGTYSLGVTITVSSARSVATRKLRLK